MSAAAYVKDIYRSWNSSTPTPTAQPSTGRPPTPPPKDAPSSSSTPKPGRDGNTLVDLNSLIRPSGLSRAGSIYSLSRVSFSSQISQLTAIKLPDAGFLKSSISAISTATAAAKTLTDAADQLQIWIQRASDVLEGLDAGDDAEWAAAAGRDGLDEVNLAITRFEGLVNVFVNSVEDLQLRQDASTVPIADMKKLVNHVEKVTLEWLRIKTSLANIKCQVELAIEWDDLCNGPLTDISNDLEELSRIVFEMEERRHAITEQNPSSASKERVLDIDELETIVHDAPQNPAQISSLTKSLGMDLKLQQQQQPPLQPPGLSSEPNESSLFELFARMQPLRASLDFLPMTLSTFQGKAVDVFPSACDELLQRRDALESQWEKLEGDADSLRRELGEDRWNLVFRNAGKQAIKLIDSVERSLIKVDEALGPDTQLKHTSDTIKKIENYEAKKLHYCTAIDRVLSIVDKGVKDRLTVNGEILRLRQDLRQRWQTLQRDMKHMDSILDDYATDTKSSGQQQELRDSLSSILSTERSLESSNIATPGTSPPSSVVSTRSRRGSIHDQQHLASAQHSAAVPSETVEQTHVLSTQQEYWNTSAPSVTLKSSPTTSIPTYPTASSSKSPPQQIATPLKNWHPPSRQAPSTDRPRWNYSRTSNGDYNVSDYYKSLLSKGSLVNLSPKSASRVSSLSTTVPAANPSVHAAQRASSYNSSVTQTTPTSSPLSNKGTTNTTPATTNNAATKSAANPRSTTTSSRPPLSRKASDLSNAPAQPKHGTTSQTRVAQNPTAQNSPLSIHKRKAAASSAISQPSSSASTAITKRAVSAQTTSASTTAVNSSGSNHAATSSITSSQFSSPASSPRTSIGPTSAGDTRSRSSSHIPVPVDHRSKLASHVGHIDSEIATGQGQS